MPRSANSKQRILDAASELARTEGSAHLSLDAVAARAGISKGGLLYNFPTKTALLKALVQQFIEHFEATLNAVGNAAGGGPLARDYFEVALEDLQNARPPSSGLLAALSEDPELLSPVRQFNRKLLDRMKSGSTDYTAVLMLFMVLEGMRCQKLLGTEVLTADERNNLLKRLEAMLG
ncbi:TetR/AcrR family transcriptional regulator [Chelativorans sp.]|uniref:TetR/AcrR family transcriptional regulator n=1 Tax=Chelativorans sp. TaxID=2203393 RepID=UPI002812195D|nr:TetR/AcrR family transcriptional regulator [Chelativorans sp.]